MKSQINNIKLLKEYRKALRNALTPAEAALWKMIQRSQIEGRKFRRQHSVGYTFWIFIAQPSDWPLSWTGPIIIPPRDLSMTLKEQSI